MTGVPGDDLVLDGAGKRGPECVACVLAAPRRQQLVAAVPDGAAAALGLWPLGVFALSAAQARAGQFVEPGPDVADGDLVEPLAADVRNDVQPGERLVLLVGLRRQVGPHHLVEPVRQELIELGPAAEAQACARWYRDAPEWQRIAKVGRATRELIAAIGEAAGEYWAELRQDIRVRGFTRILAARVSRAISETAGLLAGRLGGAGHRDSRAWQAAWGLHRASAACAGRVMRHAPSPAEPADRMTDVRRIIGELGGRPATASEPPVSSQPPASRQPVSALNAVALATASFPAPVSDG